MRVLICGDIVGKSGRHAIRRELPNLKKLKQIDFVLANGENLQMALVLQKNL